MTVLHDQLEGNMSSCFFNAEWSDSSSEEKKSCGRSGCMTQNHVHIPGVYLLVTRQGNGCITWMTSLSSRILKAVKLYSLFFKLKFRNGKSFAQSHIAGKW